MQNKGLLFSAKIASPLLKLLTFMEKHRSLCFISTLLTSYDEFGIKNRLTSLFLLAVTPETTLVLKPGQGSML